MYRLLILSIVLVTLALADVDKRECEKIFDPRVNICCKKISDIEDNFTKSEDIKECFQLNMDPATCEYDLCVAKKKGFITADMKIDKKILEELTTKDFSSEVDLMKDYKSECFDGDLDKYGPPEFCDFFKMRNCFKMQMFKHCPEWSINDKCNELKGLVQECEKLF